MIKNQIEWLVSLQDLDIMLQELDEVQKLGFEMHKEGKAKLEGARKELIEKINKPLVGMYERLRARYKRAIVPVIDDTCSGCFMKLPTYLITLAQRDKEVISCEGCGRILYWL
ncbi:MAG: zinc ribbon domain-containing protein [bacterium]